MKVFRVFRQNDISGVSGTGLVLYGVVFEDGTTVIRWNTKTPSTSIFSSYEEFKKIHIDPHPENNSIEQIHSVKWLTSK